MVKAWIVTQVRWELYIRQERCEDGDVAIHLVKSVRTWARKSAMDMVSPVWERWSRNVSMIRCNRKGWNGRSRLFMTAHVRARRLDFCRIIAVRRGVVVLWSCPLLKRRVVRRWGVRQLYGSIVGAQEVLWSM